MNSEIAQRQQDAMQSNGLDAIISCSPENFAYIAGFVVPSQTVIRHRHAMAILTANAEFELFGVDMEKSTIEERAKNIPLRTWAEFTDDPMVVLADQLQRLGLSNSNIGIELDYIPAGDFNRLRENLPKANFVGVEDILSKLRQIKTKDEIQLMRKLSRIADQAIAESLDAVRAGDTEMDIASHLTRNVYRLGSHDFKMMIIATGERSQLPNVGPTQRILCRGDVCRVEIFVVIDGYQAGVCRTAVVQEAPQMANEIWSHLVDCKYQILEMVKPGVKCRTIYDAFCKKLAEMKLPPISFVGHGIGLHLHENPYLGKTSVLGKPNEEAVLASGMVLGFEPLCYQTGFGFGMQNKDVLLVTDQGAELLSDYTNTDKLLAVN